MVTLQPLAPVTKDEEDPRFDAFRRDDHYGRLGAAQLAPWEYILLAVAAVTIVPLKFLLCFLGVFFCWLTVRILMLLPPHVRYPLENKVGKAYVRFVLLSMGFYSVRWVKVQSENGHSHNTRHNPAVVPPAVIVSNHVSYTDILVHMSQYYPAFVARADVVHLPLIGALSKSLGCLYADRGFKKDNIMGVSAQVKDRIQKRATNGISHENILLIFPEGTTTNGRYLLPFKRGAFLAGAPVLPVVLKYGKGLVSPAWESISAPRHVFLMLAHFHSVTAYELPVYIPSEAEKKDPALYANNVREVMMKFGKFGSSSATMMDCREYIAMMEGKPPPPKAKKLE